MIMAYDLHSLYVYNIKKVQFIRMNSLLLYPQSPALLCHDVQFAKTWENHSKATHIVQQAQAAVT